MGKGKFSSPRPYREEDRQIEQAYRQVTGQEPLPKPNPAEDELLRSLPVDPAPSPEVDISALLQGTDTLESPSAGTPEPPRPQKSFFPEEQPMTEDPLPEADGEDAWEEEDKTFLVKLLDFGQKVMDFCVENKKIALIALCAAALLIIVSVISVFFASASDPYDHKILSNIYVAGVNVGGMTKKEAVSAVKQSSDIRYARDPMVVLLAGSELRLSAAEIDPKLNVKAAVNAAYDFGRTGTNAEKQQAYESSLSESYYVPLARFLTINERRIREALDSYAEAAGNTITQTQYGLEGVQPPLSADKFDKNTPCQTLVITMGTPGIQFDTDDVLAQILEAYSRFAFEVTIENLESTVLPDPLDLDAVYQEFYIAPTDATVAPNGREPIPAIYGYGFDLEKAKEMLAQAEYGEVLQIPMEYIEPDILENELQFLDILGEYRTSHAGEENRTNNLRLACQALNGVTLEPGATFSFNDTLGQRTTEKGYRYAYADPNSDEDQIVGGGITQVASTLYYCALLSDLEITARKNQTYPVSYIDYGMDADIRWNNTDLKFKNNTDRPIKIEAEVSGKSVDIRILGTDQRSYYVKLESRIQNTYVPDTEYEEMEPDNHNGYQDGDVLQKGRNGFHIKTFMLKYDRQTNELVSRDAIADSRYQAVNEIVVRITEEETTEPTEEETEEPTEETEEETTEEATTAASEESSEEPDDSLEDSLEEDLAA